jgi:O-antigen/teichoic acid export membrane protein
MSEKELEVQRHGMMYLVSSTGITLIGFLATMFYAHWVGAGVLGQYFLFLSFFAIACQLTDLGIGYAVTYRICEGKDPDEYFTACLVLRLSLWLLVTAGMLCFRFGFGTLGLNDSLWLALIVVLGISTLVSSLSTAIGASNRLGLAASVSLIDNTTRIIVQVIAVFLGFQVYGLIGGLAAGLMTEIFIDIRFVDYKLKKFHRSHIRGIWSFSSWAFLSTFCTILFDSINPLIIAFFLPISDVGIFGVCWTLSVFALFVSTALCNTLFVKVTRWKAAGDWDAITIALSRSTSYALVLAIPMLIGGAILGERLLYYMYSASFAVGASALVIIIGARVVQSIFQLYSNFLMAADHVKHQFLGLFTGIVVNIILACILVPVWGLPGAAAATLINVIISTIICRHFLQQIIPIRVDMKTLADIFIAAVVMTVVILPSSILFSRSLFTTCALVCTGAVVYLAVLFLRNEQIREDIMKTLKIRWIA